MLAHELRNPLAPDPQRAAASCKLKGRATTPRSQWARDVIDRQVQQMTRLVDDLLDVSRISTRQDRAAVRAASSCRRSIDAAVETSRPLIAQRGHELRVDLPPEPRAGSTATSCGWRRCSPTCSTTPPSTRRRRPHRADGGAPRARRGRDRVATTASASRATCCPGCSTCSPRSTVARALAGRPRHRPDAGQAAGGAARRARRGPQRRPRRGQRIRRAPAGAGRGDERPCRSRRSGEPPRRGAPGAACWWWTTTRTPPRASPCCCA